MKDPPIFFLFLLSTQLCLAQFNFGLQGGINFDSSGDIKLVSEQFQKEGRLNSKTGFHIGAYAEVDLMVFYLRPEIQYTKVRSEFENNTIDNTRIELPVSVGITVLGPLSVFLGPTAYFNLSQKSAELSLDALKDNTNLGMHIGTRVQLGPVGVDFRYEKGFSSVQSQILSQAGVPTGGEIDTRANQFILGISFKLN